jgi:hypothetical protein
MVCVRKTNENTYSLWQIASQSRLVYYAEASANAEKKILNEDVVVTKGPQALDANFTQSLDSALCPGDLIHERIL